MINKADAKPTLDRLKFMLSFGSLGVLAGCGAAAKVISVPDSSGHALADAMRRAGLASVRYKNKIYSSDGSTRVVSDCYSSAASGLRSAMDCSNDAGAISNVVIGEVTASTGANFTMQTTFNGGSMYYYVPVQTGAMYTVDHPANQFQCPDAIAAAAGVASAAAVYIRDNAYKYAPAIAKAATDAIDAYTETGWGVAASLEFLGLLFASLGPLEIALLLAAIGVSAYFIWRAFNCSAS